MAQTEDRMICFCHSVRLSELREAIERGATDIYSIQVETLATTGCGGCESDVLELIEEITRDKPEP